TYAADHGAKILSMSLGGPTPPQSVLNAVNYAYTTKGCLLFGAAGNGNGLGLDYPAAYANVVGVGACSPCNERTSPSRRGGENWWGSNCASDLDSVGPGVLITTTDIVGTGGYSVGDYFNSFNGTSSATPDAAGIAALVWSAKPSLTNTQVWNTLKNTCE